MTRDSAGVQAGELAGALRHRVDLAARQRLTPRLVEGDPTLWPMPAEAEGRLGWLKLPSSMAGEAPGLRDFADEVARDGVQDVVVLGMGGSSLAPEVFESLLGGNEGRPRLTVLDSTHPVVVSAHLEAFPPETSLYVVASKSGTTLETDSLFRSFWEAAGEEGGSRFIAITDPGTPLAELARTCGFRRLFLAPEDVGGRFSALSPFGLVPAALIGADLEPLMEGAAGVLDAPESAVELGLLMGEAVLAGRDKITLVADASLAPFVAWLEQLLAESTGKSGTGVVPVSGESSDVPLGSDRLFVGLTLDDSGDAAVRLRALSAAGHPVAETRWSGPEAVGAEMMRWELATAAAAAVINVQAFDQPDVDLAKRLAREAMSGSGGAEADDPTIVDAGDAEALQAAIGQWLAGASAGDYIALQAFLPAVPEIQATVDSLRADLAATGLPTTLGYGPRFLHSTGQLHKGGRKGVFCLQLVDGSGGELGVPGSGYTYRQLIDAQALGDARALARKGRRVLRVSLDG